MTRTNLFKRITALTVAGISAITVASCTAQPSPMETIEDAIEVNIDKLADSEKFSNIEKFYNRGSMELKGNLSKIIELAAGTPMDIDASIKMYADMDADTPASALTADLGMNGTALIDLAIYFTQTNMALKSNALLGEDAYGITFANVPEKFESSIFGPDGEYALDLEEIEFLIAYFEILGSASSDVQSDVQIMENLEKSLENLVDELKPTVYKTLEGHGNATIVDGTVTLAENEVKTVDVALNFDANGIINVTKELLTAVKGSQNLKPTIEALYAYIEVVNNQLSSIDPSSSIDMSEFSVDEVYSEIMTAIDDALASYEELGLSEDEIPTVNLSVIAHIAKKTGELLSVSLELKADDTPDAGVELVLATSLSPDWGLYVDAEGEKTVVAYNVTANTDTTFESALHVDADGISCDILSLKCDKTTGEYTVSITDPEYGETVASVAGKYQKDKNSKTITVSEIIAEGETYDIGEISLIITYEDKMPTIESFTEILDLTAEDMEAIGANIIGGISSLAYLLSEF